MPAVLGHANNFEDNYFQGITKILFVMTHDDHGKSSLNPSIERALSLTLTICQVYCKDDLVFTTLTFLRLHVNNLRRLQWLKRKMKKIRSCSKIVTSVIQGEEELKLKRFEFPTRNRISFLSISQRLLLTMINYNGIQPQNHTAWSSNPSLFRVILKQDVAVLSSIIRPRCSKVG